VQTTPSALSPLAIASWALPGLRYLLAAFFAFMAFKNLAGDEAMAADFQRWGYPGWFRITTAVLQLAGGVALLSTRTTFPGALLLACILLGAAVTHWRFDPASQLASPLVFLALVGVLLVLHRPGR